MFERRSLRLPIFLGVTMIILVVILTVGWILLAVFAAMETKGSAAFYIALLSLGIPFLITVLVGVVIYLTLSVKAINLNRRQTNFIDSVTHELKSPIASLKLYLQTMARRTLTDAERHDFHQFMLEDVERLDQLINHMLDAARLEKERKGEDTEDVQLHDLICHCGESVRLRYRVGKDVIQYDLQPCAVRAATVDVDMIFRNLLDNAVKYAGDDPQVTVHMRSHSEGIVVRICDNGRGIPVRHRRKVFRRFVRLGLELERDKPGTGLGLYIVATLIRRLRGHIRVRERDGPGTEFEVVLPGHLRVDEPDSSSNKSVHANPEDPASKQGPSDAEVA